MALVPEELISSYQLQKPEIRLDDEIVKLLDQSKISDDMKAKLLSQLITRYHRVVHEPREPIPVKIEQPKEPSLKISDKESERPEVDNTFRSIVSSVPKSSAKYVPFILEKLRTRGIGWNEDGEMTQDNSAIKEGNIVDFFSYLMRNSKDQIEPKHFSEFLKAIKEVKIPTSWITNKRLYKNLNKLQDPIPRFPSDVSPDFEDRRFSPTIRRKRTKSLMNESLLSDTPKVWRSRSQSPKQKWLNY